LSIETISVAGMSVDPFGGKDEKIKLSWPSSDLDLSPLKDDVRLRQ
jgi:hypothetical protein